MNPLEWLVGWKLKIMCAALMAGTLALGVGTLWLTYKATEKDRDQIITSFETACGYVGVPYRLDASGKPLRRKDWGLACLAKILKNATEAAGASAAGLNTYVAHDAEQTAKAATDRPAARRSAQRIQSGQQQMEQAIDHSQDGHLGPDYFDGLNRALGLRPYVGASSPGSSGSDHAEGQADAGSAGL